MTRSTPLWRSLAVIGVASLVLAACGGDGDPETEETSDSTAGAEPTSENTYPAATGDPALNIGTLLPLSGSLSFLGPPMTTGATLAMEDINAAGGIDGAPISLTPADEGDSTVDIVGQSATALLNSGVNAILGAASTGRSQLVYSAITGAGVLQISPSNTGVEVSSWETGGLYFRTAPSDLLQGEILGQVILDDGHESVGILYLDSPYGQGLADSVDEVVSAGGVEVVYKEAFAEGTETYAAEASAMAAEDPDAIVVISYDQIYSIIPELANHFDDLSNLYMVDGNTKDFSVGPTEGSPGLPAGIVEGAKGTIPGQSVEGSEFGDRLLQITPNLDSYTYAGEAYDAIVLVTLASIQAGATDGASIAAEMAAVSGGGGEQCSAFHECKSLIEAGEDVDYEGVSGPIEFAENGDPQSAFIGIYEFGADNVPEFQEARTLDVE